MPLNADMTSQEFFKRYGDCYISGISFIFSMVMYPDAKLDIPGFIDGGELHGIISMRILDRSRIHEIRSQCVQHRAISWWELTSSYILHYMNFRIKNGLNSAGPTELNLGGLSGNQFQTALNETETTISVSWSGGGQIKPGQSISVILIIPLLKNQSIGY